MFFSVIVDTYCGCKSIGIKAFASIIPIISHNIKTAIETKVASYVPIGSKAKFGTIPLNLSLSSKSVVTVLFPITDVNKVSR